VVAASSETQALQLERIRKKKKRGKVIVSVEDILFVFLVMQTVITTTPFFLGSRDRWIYFLHQLTLNWIHRSVINFLFFFF